MLSCDRIIHKTNLFCSATPRIHVNSSCDINTLSKGTVEDQSKDSLCCRVDGSLSEPSPGSVATVVLAKDYENLADTLAASVTLAAIQFGLGARSRVGFSSQAL